MFQIWRKSVKNINAVVNKRWGSQKPEVSRHACSVTYLCHCDVDHDLQNLSMQTILWAQHIPLTFSITSFNSKSITVSITVEENCSFIGVEVYCRRVDHVTSCLFLHIHHRLLGVSSRLLLLIDLADNFRICDVLRLQCIKQPFELQPAANKMWQDYWTRPQSRPIFDFIHFVAIGSQFQ